MSQDKSNKNTASGESPEARGQDPSHSLPTENDNSVGKVQLFILEIITLCGVATGLWVFGEHVDKNGYEKTGSFINFTSFIGFFALVPVAVLKIWPDAKRVWSSFGLFCIAFGILWLALGKVSKPPPKLQFGLQMPPLSAIWITNSEALANEVPVSSLVAELEFQHDGPFLVIPSSNNGSVIDLFPAITNASPTEASDVNISLSILGNIPTLTSADGWEVTRTAASDVAMLWRMPALKGNLATAIPAVRFGFPEVAAFSSHNPCPVRFIGITVSSHETRRFTLKLIMVSVPVWQNPSNAIVPGVYKGIHGTVGTNDGAWIQRSTNGPKFFLH